MATFLKKSPDGGFGLVERMVRRANQRAGLDMLEAHPLTEALAFGKFVGMHEANDGKMFARGLKILS